MKIIILFLLSILIGISIVKAYYLIVDKNYYGWPAVTKCRICNKTVWVWQNYERRSFTVEGNSRISISASGGFVHKNCKGHPKFEVKIK